MSGTGIQISIQPTERFFMAGEVMVRAWAGVDQDGRPVVALIAGIRGPDPMVRLVEIPPPDADAARQWAETILRKASS